MEMARQAKTRSAKRKEQQGSGATPEVVLSTMRKDAEALRIEAMAARQDAINRKINVNKILMDWEEKRDKGFLLLEENAHLMEESDVAIANQFMAIAEQRIEGHRRASAEAQSEIDRLDEVANDLLGTIQEIDGANRRVNVRRALVSASRGLNTEISPSALTESRVKEIQDKIRQATAFTRGITEIINEEMSR